MRRSAYLGALVLSLAICSPGFCLDLFGLPGKGTSGAPEACGLSKSDCCRGNCGSCYCPDDYCPKRSPCVCAAWVPVLR